MSYDLRYLTGIVLFNRGDWFEAHECWEDPWAEATGPERRLYQGLIQAAVGLCHFSNGNLRGAVKLYHSSHDYLARCGDRCLGLDVPDFLRQMERCFAALLLGPEPTRGLEPDAELLPSIRLDPEPEAWPEPPEGASEEESP